MAKRFTDTDKWKKHWFRSLETKFKLVWIYLCDACDHAGIWDVDLDLLQFQTGVKVTLGDLISVFRGKLHLFDQGSKLWVIPFFEFQYGTSKNKFNVRDSALQRLVKLGLVDESGNTLSTVLEELTNTSATLPQELTNSIGISISKGISKKGGVGENKTPASSFNFEPLWQSYPRKVNKAVGIRRAQQVIKTHEDFQALAQAISNYSDRCAREETEQRYIKHFATFIEDRDEKPYVQPWREYVRPEPESTACGPRKSKLAEQAEREMAEAMREFGLEGSP